MRNLSIASLQLACWIAKLGSFTAAAERLHTTQPGVSARVRELEEAVGQKLFTRQGRGVEPTVEGREFVREAERVLQEIEALSMSFTKAGAVGLVRIGTSSICLDLVAALTVHLAQAMPKVSYDVEIERAARLLDGVEARKLDLAMVSGPVDLYKFDAMSLGVDRMLWVASPRVLAERWSGPSATRLKGLPVWCVNRDSFYWSEATRKLEGYGVDLDRINAIDNTLGAARIVAAGGGIGLLSESLVQRALKEGLLVPLPELAPGDDIEFSVVALKDNGSRIVGEIMAAAVAVSTFRRARPGV